MAKLVTVRRTVSLTTRWFGRREGIVLFVAFVLVAAVTAFVQIADEVVEGETRTFDEWMLRLLREPDNPHVPLGPVWVMEAAQDITALGGRTLLIVTIVAAIGYLALDGKRGAAWLVAVAAGGGGLLSTTLKYAFGRERPEIVPHLVTVASPSFPSGHSMLAAIVYLTLGALLARFVVRRRVRLYILAVAALLTVFVGASRVYLGVHYPTDVLSGWTAGLAWALLCWLVARYLQKQGTVEAPG